jgi:hypothetical protein
MLNSLTLSTSFGNLQLPFRGLLHPIVSMTDGATET